MEPQEIISNNTDILIETTNADKTAIAADLEQRILNSKKRKAERKEKKEQKKAKYMETISTKNAKEGQTVKVQQPDPNSSSICQFYLKKKARFCNQHPKEGIFLRLLNLFKLFERN